MLIGDTKDKWGEERIGVREREEERIRRSRGRRKRGEKERREEK